MSHIEKTVEELVRIRDYNTLRLKELSECLMTNEELENELKEAENELKRRGL